MRRKINTFESKKWQKILYFQGFAMHYINHDVCRSLANAYLKNVIVVFSIQNNWLYYVNVMK